MQKWQARLTMYKQTLEKQEPPDKHAILIALFAPRLSQPPAFFSFLFFLSRAFNVFQQFHLDPPSIIRGDRICALTEGGDEAIEAGGDVASFVSPESLWCDSSSKL